MWHRLNEGRMNIVAKINCDLDDMLSYEMQGIHFSHFLCSCFKIDMEKKKGSQRRCMKV